jgi:DNA-directed RNA polymerase subunit L
VNQKILFVNFIICSFFFSTMRMEFDATNQRFLIQGQDHTLGGLLCSALNLNARVTFCGYKVHEDQLEVMVHSQSPVECMQEAVVHILGQIAHLQKSIK